MPAYFQKRESASHCGRSTNYQRLSLSCTHARTQMHDLASPSDSSYFGSPCGSVQPESVLTAALTLVEICSGLIMWIHVYISALYVSELSERCRRWRENTLVMSFDVGQSTVSECGDRWSGRRSGGRFLCWFVFDWRNSIELQNSHRNQDFSFPHFSLF